ncbi:hypothetical protein SVAN01_04908 [Stagonosporopsis vannaccii]|nr:hypothetical protein SVAN01_04908 [Stagonosporopsis vannaccii]
MTRCNFHSLFTPFERVASSSASSATLHAQIAHCESVGGFDDDSSASTILPASTPPPTIATVPTRSRLQLALCFAIFFLVGCVFVASYFSQTIALWSATPHATNQAACNLAIHLPGGSTCIFHAADFPTKGATPVWIGTRELTVYTEPLSTIDTLTRAARTAVRPVVRILRSLYDSVTEFLRIKHVRTLPDALITYAPFGVVGRWARTTREWVVGLAWGAIFPSL